jgi:hypothetical protein
LIEHIRGVDRRSRRLLGILTGVGIGVLICAPLGAATRTVKAPLTCSRGGAQTFSVAVSAPEKAAQASTFAVRVDSFPSGKIEHTGLNYLHDMEAELVVPAGTRFVEGSAKIVAGTGTPNVAKSALVWHWNGVLHFKLPARVENGGSYTPPSIEFQLTVTAPPGSDVPLKLLRYTVKANAFVVGDVTATCDPTPAPYTLATTTVTKA